MSLPINPGAKDPSEGLPSVRDLQTRLINKGFSCGMTGADGEFGPNTLLAVKRYQLRVGLPVRGIVDGAMWAVLTRTATGGQGSAGRMADLALKLVTQGIDGKRPRYVFGAETNLRDASPDRIDCSELVQWATYQITGHDWVDGSRNQYASGTHISVAEGMRTKGALLFLSNGGPLGIHHVAINAGGGRTAEARSASRGCGSWLVTGRGWRYAAKVRTLRYGG